MAFSHVLYKYFAIFIVATVFSAPGVAQTPARLCILVAMAKARPGQLNFAIGAVGPSLHLAGELGVTSGKRLAAFPDVPAMLESEGAIAVGNSPEEFAAFVQGEITRWAKVVKFSGAGPE